MHIQPLFALVLLLIVGTVLSNTPTIRCRATSVLEETDEEVYYLDADLEGNTCDDKLVCKFKCLHARLPKKCRKVGYFDLTQRLATHPDEKLVYEYICETRMFSYSGYERSDPISLKFAHLVIEALNRDSKSKYTYNDFVKSMQQDKTRFKDSYWSAKVVTWAKQRGLSKNNNQVFSLLLKYKDGLRGFAKLCQEKKFSKDQVKGKLVHYCKQQENKAKNIGKRKLFVIEQNSMISVFWTLNQKKYKKYKNAFNVEKKKLDTVILKQIEQKKPAGNCLCYSYGRFFALMAKKSKKSLQQEYGFSSNFNMKQMEKTYNSWFRYQCGQICGQPIKK